MHRLPSVECCASILNAGSRPVDFISSADDFVDWRSTSLPAGATRARTPSAAAPAGSDVDRQSTKSSADEMKSTGRDPAFKIDAQHSTEGRRCMSEAYTGGCACGVIRYEISGEPLASNDCQCRDCQRKSGTGHG